MKLFAFFILSALFFNLQASLASEAVREPQCSPDSTLGAVVRSLRERSEARRSEHVTERVPGLYESIPIRRRLEMNGYRFETNLGNDHGRATFETRIYDQRGGLKGVFYSNYDSYSRTLRLEVASLDSAEAATLSFVQNSRTVDLVPGRGVPTQMWVRLHHMRLADISPGGPRLRQVIVSDISNRRTQAELLQTPEIRQWLIDHTNEAGLHPDADLTQLEALLGRHFEQTQTGRYVRDMLTQSGFCIAERGFQYSGLVLVRPRLEFLTQSSQREAYRAMEQVIADGIHQVPNINFSVSVDVGPCAGR